MHNSLLKEDRWPQGALVTGEQLRLRVHLSGAYARLGEQLRLRLWMLGRETVLCGSAAPEGADAVVTFHVTMPDLPGLVWYYFYLDHQGKRIFYGGISGQGRFYEDLPQNYQITVYSREFSTPRWFRESIMYQIFPDRFRRDGQRGGLDRLEYHRNLGRRTLAQEDWSAEPIYRPLEGEEDYDPCDYFGGTLRGIEEALPYLSSLHVGCVYLNPVFEAASNHRYNTADYRRVDPVLGCEKDLASLAQAGRQAGMRLMLDGVFSHTGADSIYFDRFGNYGKQGAYQSQDSPYYQWYRFSHWPDAYASWWGFQSLPEVNEAEPDYMNFIAGEGDCLLAHWAAHGVTSWRLDVADELPDEFIAALRARLKHLDPEGVLLGEVWEDATNKVSHGGLRAYCYGGELDSVMNYPFANAVFAFLLGREDAGGLTAAFNGLRERYPKPMYYALMNLLDSHDTVRALSVLSGAPDRNALPREEQAKVTFSLAALERGKARLKLAVLLQMSMPGVPCIYYGDEAGMLGMADPFNRRSFPWGKEDEELLCFYRAATAARAGSDALKGGLAAFAAITPHVFAVARCIEHGRNAFDEPAENGYALTLVNRSEQEQAVTVTEGMFLQGPDGVAMGKNYWDAISGKPVAAREDGSLWITLPPLDGVLLMDHPPAGRAMEGK